MALSKTHQTRVGEVKDIVDRENFDQLLVAIPLLQEELRAEAVVWLRHPSHLLSSNSPLSLESSTGRVL